MQKLSLAIIGSLLFVAVVVQFAPVLAQSQLVASPSAAAPTASEAAIPTVAVSTPTPTPIPPPNNPINLTLSPVFIQLETNPGEAQSTEIKLRNNGVEDETLRVSFATFSFNEATQEINLNNQVDERYLQWLSVDKPLFTIKPSEWETITATFSPPADASLSYYYAIVFNRAAEPDTGTTKISGAPAVLVLTTVVSPLAKRELQLDSFTVPKVWVEFLPQQFLLKIRNTGNVHLPPTGNIFIDSSNQKDIAVLSINPANSLILPNSSRDFTVTWDDGFPKYETKTENGQPVLNENGETTQTLTWNFSEADRFRIGKYTAHLLLVYDNGERDVPIESFVSFWVIPWRITLAFIVVTLFFLLGIGSALKTVWRSVKQPK